MTFLSQILIVILKEFVFIISLFIEFLKHPIDELSFLLGKLNLDAWFDFVSRGDNGTLGERLRQVFEKSPSLIVLLYSIILYSIITLIILTVFILLNRKRMESRTKRKSQLSEKYQSLLMDYFFIPEQEEKVKEALRKIAINDFSRKILINEIIELSVNMQEYEKGRLRELYLDLGLKMESLKNVYSKKWHENIKGFRDLAFMNIREANDKILKCLNSNNSILRMEAQIALVRLSDENPYRFLDFLEQPLSAWEQVTINELLTQHNLTAPDFNQWLESGNLTIVRFSLQMVAKFKQVNALSGVLHLLNHNDEGVRKEAIRTCGELESREALAMLEKLYQEEIYENREEILKTFGKIPDEKYLNFLNKVLDQEEDVNLQILATKAMENMDEPGIARLIKLMKSKSEYRNYKIIIRHVLDRRIY